MLEHGKHVICFSGTHGTGKTYAALEKGTELKKQYPNKSVFVLQERIRKCPFEINEAAGPFAQEWIFHNLMTGELDALADFDIVVSDRSIFDCIAYTKVQKLHSLADEMMGFAVQAAYRYSHIYVRYADENPYHHDDGVRSKSPQWRAEVEAALIDVYATAAQKGAAWGKLHCRASGSA